MLSRICFCHQSIKLSKIIYNGFRQFSELHARIAIDIISKYSEKSARARLKQGGHVYLIDPDIANSVASTIAEEWRGGYILEANPGPGILSCSLLKYGINKLRVLEKNQDFLPALEVLSNANPSFEIVQEDLLLLPSFESKGSHNDLHYLENFFYNIQDFSWEDDVPFQVFSIVSSKRSIKFLRYLLAVLPLRSSIFAFGRCEFFLLTNETEYMYMKAVPKENFSMYRWSTVLYNLFFEIQCLKELSSESLFPLSNTRRKKRNTVSSNFYLMKLTPKADLFSNLVTQNKLTDLYFFVRHHLVKRTALIIPTLESWIPLCGPRLIKEGMHVFTKFGDLSPEQILMLFNQFSSWPEYEDSAFQAAARRFHFHDQFSCDDDDDQIKIEKNS